MHINMQCFVRFKVLIANVMMKVFWDIEPCNLIELDVSKVRTASMIKAINIYSRDDGGSTHFRNVGLLQQNYMALYPRRLSYSEIMNLVSHIR
jgi:hypothetical protein